MNGFSKEDLLMVRSAIQSNLTTCITNICAAMKKLGIPYDNPENGVRIS